MPQPQPAPRAPSADTVMDNLIKQDVLEAVSKIARWTEITDGNSHSWFYGDDHAKKLGPNEQEIHLLGHGRVCASSIDQEKRWPIAVSYSIGVVKDTITGDMQGHVLAVCRGDYRRVVSGDDATEQIATIVARYKEGETST